MTILADKLEDSTLTEAQILALPVSKKGITHSAADTKRRIHFSNVDEKFYSSTGEVWSGSAWAGGVGNTAGVAVSTPTTESISGAAATQQAANIESKGAIEANTESILNLTGASMKIAEFGGTFATTEVMFDFDTITPSDNTSLLAADDTTNIVTLGKELRYQFQTFLSVNTTSQGAKVITLRVYNNADDSLLSTRNVDVDGGQNNDQVFPLDAVFLDNPLAGLEIYFTAQCTDTGVDLVELNTTVITGGGGGGGIWDIQDGEIVNIGARPVNVAVATVGIGDVMVTGTGTAYDATYTDTGNGDTFGNPTLSDATNTLIKDDTNAYWCLVSGVTTTNPVFTVSQYCNFTGSIAGVYTVVLGAGADGTATIMNGAGGSHAIRANSDIIAPVFEIAGKAARRYNFEDGYIVDTLIEPESGAAFVIIANGVARMAIPVSGIEKMMNVYRSMVLGGETDAAPNLATDINNTIYDKTFIPCNTTATGADLGVSGSAQIIKKMLIGALQASGDRIILDPANASLFENGAKSGETGAENAAAVALDLAKYHTGGGLADTVTNKTLGNVVSANDIPERAALGDKAFVAREDLTYRAWVTVTASTGFTVSGSNPMKSAISSDGDLVFQGRVDIDSGTISTAAINVIATIVVSQRPLATVWGGCIISTSTGQKFLPCYIATNGNITVAKEYGSTTYTATQVIIDSIFIKNRG